MDNQTLCSENLTYAGTRGISENNRALNFRPAFLDRNTGRFEIAKMKNGEQAPVHIICWLPQEWAEEELGQFAGLNRPGKGHRLAENTGRPLPFGFASLGAIVDYDSCWCLFVVCHLHILKRGLIKGLLSPQ